MAKLADAPALGAGGATHEGSTPSPRTIFWRESNVSEVGNCDEQEHFQRGPESERSEAKTGRLPLLALR